MRKPNILALVAVLAASVAGALFATPAYAASYVVNTLNDDTTDDAFCTLREAINAANNTGGSNTNCGGLSSAGDTITFSVSGTIGLGSVLPNILSGQGQLTIDGGDDVIVNGNSIGRVLRVNSNATLTLQNITIANGNSTGGGGGGILNEGGTLTITNSTISGNQVAAGFAGGGIYNEGVLTVTNSTFSSNSANASGGEGGAIINTGTGTMTISDSTFSANSAGPGGGGLSNYGGLVTITNSTFTGNSATSGGGIFNNSTITITDSTFSGNTATSRGGGMTNLVAATVTNTTFSGNTAPSGAGISNPLAGSLLTVTDSTFSTNSATPTVNSTGGGAIFNGGTATITNSTLSNNSLAAFSQFSGGAGISNFGTLTLTKSTLSNNTMTAGINSGGAGISNYGTLTVGNSSFSNNSITGNVGGGIYTSSAGSLSVTKSTFSGNSTNASGGGIYGLDITIANSTFSGNSAAASGGGILAGNSTIANSTFSGNSATTSGGGIIASGANLTVYNTIVADSTAGGNCSGTFAAASTNNMATDSTCGSSSTQVTSAQLNLGAFTGSPAYFPLNSGSAAIDAGSNTRCASAPVNNESQNGPTRPVDGDANGTAICDIGSYEAPVASPSESGVADTEDGNRGSKEIADSGTTTFAFERAYVSVPASAIPAGETNCKIVVANRGDSDEYGFDVDDVVYDVKIVCDSGEVTILFAPITVCIRPKDRVTSDKQLFHKHAGAGSFAPIAGSTGPNGYVCGSTQVLSLFSLGEFFLPDTGFAPGVVTQLREQSVAAAYYEYDQLMLEIPELGVMTPIWGVPQSQNGWDVSWLGEAAGYLYGTAFPTWVGNSVLTAHVWNADNTAGPFYHLRDLQHGDQFYIHAYGQTYVYEVRSNRLVSEKNLSVMSDSDYSLITLITCESFSESSGEYLYRRAVQAVLLGLQ